MTYTAVFPMITALTMAMHQTEPGHCFSLWSRTSNKQASNNDLAKISCTALVHRHTVPLKTMHNQEIGVILGLFKSNFLWRGYESVSKGIWRCHQKEKKKKCKLKQKAHQKIQRPAMWSNQSVPTSVSKGKCQKNQKYTRQWHYQL